MKEGESFIFAKMEKSEWTLLILLILLSFFLGMSLEKSIVTKRYDKIFLDIQSNINNSIQRYNFNTTKFSPIPNNETLNFPFVCILGNETEMEKLFVNVVVPALYGQPKCFVNKGNNSSNG